MDTGVLRSGPTPCAGACPSGCDAAGICQPGNTTPVCGTGGRVCQDCQPLGDECLDGTCVCTARSCPQGCCIEGPGNPGRCFSNTPPLCGVGGALCVECPEGNTCSAQGQCACLPGSCPAGQQCCDGGCLLPNGSARTEDGARCSGNCFNDGCADRVRSWQGTRCNPPADVCAGTTCCRGSFMRSCGDSCCRPPNICCCGGFHCDPGLACCSNNPNERCAPL